jgi:SAM-dependent methyltransferase
MKSRALQSLTHWLGAFGVHAGESVRALRGVVPFVGDYRALQKQNRVSDAPWKIELNRPCLADRFDESGTASGHYFHQDLLVARRIFASKPVRHVDVGSRLDGFVAHVATFRPIEVLDIRPLAVSVPNITFRVCDVMNVPATFDDYCDSLSSLHVLEHFGLGRYGDSIDVHGYRVGFEGLRRILKRGGTLYLSVPIGRERIEFNGHRVFALPTMLNLFKDSFELINFSYVDDGGDLHENVELSPAMLNDTLGLEYGCGIFELRKTI